MVKLTKNNSDWKDGSVFTNSLVPFFESHTTSASTSVSTGD